MGEGTKWGVAEQSFKATPSSQGSRRLGSPRFCRKSTGVFCPLLGYQGQGQGRETTREDKYWRRKADTHADHVTMSHCEK